VRLEIGNFYVEHVKFEEITKLEDKVLSVNKEEILALIRQEEHLSNVDVNLVYPGENSRIIHVFDIIEPRCKVGDGDAYGGLTGDIKFTGIGRTNALRGVGVVLCEEINIPWESVIQMGGEGSEFSPYSSLTHLVIEAQPSAESTAKDYYEALMSAGSRVGGYLAEATRELEPDSVEIYEKSPLDAVDPTLPRIVYIYLIYSHSDIRETLLYGSRPRRIFPTIIHPNEVLDGAVVTANHDMPAGMRNESLIVINNPIIKELYKRHGKTINFVGVILSNEYPEFSMKDKCAAIAARMAKWQLNADGVILTQLGGGHPNVDLMLNCEKCEELGIRTTIVVSEESDSEGIQPPLVLFSPKADAIVSTGNTNELVHYGPVDEDKVFGGKKFRRMEQSIADPIEIPIMMIPGASSQIGGARLQAVEI